MACSLKSSTVVLEAARIYLGKENVTCVEPVTGLVGGESFLISNTKTNYQIWFSVGGAGIAPTPANAETLIEVVLPAAYTKVQFASLTKTAIETAKAFYGILDSVTLDAVSFETPLMGVPLTAQSDVDSGFVFTNLIVGSKEDLGNTSDGIEISFETTLYDIDGNQSGSIILDQVIQGVSSTMSMSLQEVSKERLETIIGNGFGSVYTPTGGTSLVGFGSAKNFRSSFDNAFKMVLHPIRLPDSDRSEDFTYHKTVPQPESINYSGTDKKVLSVSFTALNAERKPKEISVCAFGDSEQFLV